MCAGFYRTQRILRNPFDLDNSQGIFCHSDRSPTVEPTSVPGSAFAPGEFGTLSEVTIPILLAAIDPRQESRLVGLDRAVVAGRFLGETEGPRLRQTPDAKIRIIPLIASTKTFVDEALQASIERLDVRKSADVPTILASSRAKDYLDGLQGTRVAGVRVPLQPTYERLVNGLSEPPRFTITYDAYRTVSPVTYRSLARGPLSPETQSNPIRIWKNAFLGGYFSIPTENEDVQFRRITLHAGSNSITGGVADLPQLQVVGRFDPERIRGFSSLSKVPMESYVPPQLEPADPRSRAALGDRPLLPTLNVGGYIQQPPLAFTTLDAARSFWDPSAFSGTAGTAPISVIRIRVAGVTGPDPLSLARIKEVALSIQQTTGLGADITAGSSPTPMTVDVPPGEFGQPALTVTEGWVKKGAAVVILQALDRKSLALFLLVLVVTSLFLVNGALASVRARRTEIGTLLALGWTRRKVYEAVLGELVVVGLVAAVLGLVIALGLVFAFDLNLSVAQTLLVVPIAIVLAVLAGVIPALLASRGHPLDAVRPAVAEPDRPRPVSGIVSMSLVNTRRVPVRTVLAAAGLFVGVGALTVLLSIGLAFEGTLVGTALGRVITLQIRPADYVAVAMVIVLGAASSADVMFLNIRSGRPSSSPSAPPGGAGSSSGSS